MAGYFDRLEKLPPKKSPDPSLPHAPVRNISSLSEEQIQLAVENALRYFPKRFHRVLAEEFLEELKKYGRIYMYRFLPEEQLRARPAVEYKTRIPEAAAIMLMIHNNLDPKVAKYPQELITYGGNGAVFQNWAQYHLTMDYLRQMEKDQTLVLYSGHPMGLFPAPTRGPRVVVTNGMMVPNYSSVENWNLLNTLGVTQYGQMTAGSFMYIGPQGIVHGTTITILGAGRRCGLGEEDLTGHVFVSSGLGGMSGAQAIAGKITGVTSIIAEVDPAAIEQRISDGYIERENVFTDLDKLIDIVEKHRTAGNAVSVIYYGNIVDLWEYLAQKNVKVDLGSDQTSLHNIHDLGYCPAGYTFDEAKDLLLEDKEKFLREVRQSLRRHVKAINKIAEKRGMYFWDYGNAFLKEAGDAGADIYKSSGNFKYSSYVEDIMGPLFFDYGFGPFRWVCTSGDPKDLKTTDRIAGEVMDNLVKECYPEINSQWQDNIRWIAQAEENLPVVGSLSRILYADGVGRIKIALAFNNAIRHGILKGPVVLGRDHHDVSGTDSPYRETSDIRDGSAITADMSVHNVIGDAFRGATWVSLHNGGGVGWGEVMNGGFGMVIDGSQKSEKNIRSMLFWDVNNGIARRAWARHPNALDTIRRTMSANKKLRVTIPKPVDEEVLRNFFEEE